jgi:hypothetical protein
MASFMKAAQKPKAGDKDVESGDEEPQGGHALQGGSAAAAAASSTAPAKHTDDGSDDEEAESGPETRSQMMKRHQRELQAHKKAIQRMGKKSKVWGPDQPSLASYRIRSTGIEGDERWSCAVLSIFRASILWLHACRMSWRS